MTEMNLEEDDIRLIKVYGGYDVSILVNSEEKAKSLKQQIIQWQKKAEKYDELINQKLSS